MVELLRVSEPPRQVRNDKRRAARCEMRIAVKISFDPLADLASWKDAEMRDLSPRGVRVATDQAMTPGTSFLISLPAVGGSGATPLLCRSVHCQQVGNRLFVIGAEFIGKVDPQPKPQNDSSAEEERIRRSILD